MEVLIGMTIFAIGAAGVMSMQGATIQGNVDARRMDVANNIAREWLDRLRRDSMQWTTPRPGVAASNIGNTRWLKDAVNASATAPWILPAIPGSAPEGISPAFDFLGQDVTSADRPFYCAQYRLEWLTMADAGADPTLLRAEVRVFWPKGGDFAIPADFCTSSDTTVNAAPPPYHFVYAVTAIRENAQP